MHFFLPAPLHPHYDNAQQCRLLCLLSDCISRVSNQVDFVLIFVNLFEGQDIYTTIADVATNSLDVLHNFATVKEIAWQFFPLQAFFLLVESVSRGLVIT